MGTNKKGVIFTRIDIFLRAARKVLRKPIFFYVRVRTNKTYTLVIPSASNTQKVKQLYTPE